MVGLGVSGCVGTSEPTATGTSSALPSTTSAPTAAAEAGAEAEVTPGPITDLGARDGANGSTETTGDGTIRYTVAEGDVTGIVCDRFERRWWQLERPGTDGPFDCNAPSYPGDVLVPTDEPQYGRPD